MSRFLPSQALLAMTLLIGLTACDREMSTEPSKVSSRNGVAQLVKSSANNDGMNPEPDAWADCTTISLAIKNGKVLRASAESPADKVSETPLKELIDHLGQLPKLRSLRVYAHTSLTPEDYGLIATLRRVEDLCIEDYGSVSGTDVVALKQMPRLRSLEFEEANLDLTAYREIAGIQSLKVLFVPFYRGAAEEQTRRLRPDVRVGATHNYAP